MNSSLKAAKIIQGSSGEITDFTSDSARQVDIDVMIDSWNEVFRLLFSAGTLIKETTGSTFTLVADVTAYDLASDFERMATNPFDQDNKRVLLPYPFKTVDGKTGWLAMLELLFDRNTNLGLPSYWVIDHNNGKINIDTRPTSDEAGLVYQYVYEKRINLSAVGDTFPASDSVVDMLQIAVVEWFKKKRQQEFDSGAFNMGMTQAAHLSHQQGGKFRYGVG